MASMPASTKSPQSPHLFAANACICRIGKWNHRMVQCGMAERRTPWKTSAKATAVPTRDMSVKSVVGKRFNSIAAQAVKYGSMSKAQKAFLERVVRVDQAGELGANYIYYGQFVVLANRFPQLKPVLQHMWDQEIHHHNTFNQLQVERRVRPSLLTPLWKLGAFGIGVGTGLLGKEAAMACTVAVETVIGGHYNQQLRVLMSQYSDIKVFEASGAALPHPTPELQSSPELTKLKELISTFRDEELEHLDTAIEHDAKKAVPYMLLTEAIKAVCRTAIWTAERV